MGQFKEVIIFRDKQKKKETLYQNIYIIQVITSHPSLSLQVKPLLASHPIIFSAHRQQLGRQKVPNIAKENFAKHCQREGNNICLLNREERILPNIGKEEAQLFFCA